MSAIELGQAVPRLATRPPIGRGDAVRGSSWEFWFEPLHFQWRIAGSFLVRCDDQGWDADEGLHLAIDTVKGAVEGQTFNLPFEAFEGGNPENLLTAELDGLNWVGMTLTKTHIKPVRRRARPQRQLAGGELALLLQKADSAKSPEEKKRWRREFMRGFYGDHRGDSYA